MWSLPQSINILVVALIQNVDSTFGWTVDSRILPSCVQEVCLCRKNPELWKIIQLLPLVGTGLCDTLERHKSLKSNILQILCSAKSPEGCVTLRDTVHASCPGTSFKVVAVRVSDPWLLWTFSLNKKVKSYGSGFRFLNALRPHTLAKYRHPLKVKLAPVPSVKCLYHRLLSVPHCGFFYTCPSSQVGPRGFPFSQSFAKAAITRFSLCLHSFFFVYTDTKDFSLMAIWERDIIYKVFWVKHTFSTFRHSKMHFIVSVTHKTM